MSACPTCGNQWAHDADGLARCQAMHARRELVEALAAEYSDYVPWAPVKPVQTLDLYAHLRSHMDDGAAEAAVRVALELGWRPYGPVPDEPASEAQDAAGDGCGTGSLLDEPEVLA